jgi:hypothetical protein
MSNEEFSLEFDSLERDLESVFRVEPAADFPRRIAGVCHGELRRQRSARRWQFAITLAAGALVWMNLSLCAAPITDFHFQSRRQPPPLYQVAEKLHALLPEFSREDALREAAFLQAGVYLSLLPNPPVANVFSTSAIAE